MSAPVSAARASKPVAAFVAAFLWCGLPVAAGVPEATRPPRAALTTHYTYTVNARVRPLLFWIRRDNVGEARIGWGQLSDGRVVYELLIGTDPERAPMNINRWGYLAEMVPNGTMQGLEVSLVGVMTASDEADMDQARADVPGRDLYKAILGTATGRQAQSFVTTAALPERPTFRDVDRVLARMPFKETPCLRIDVPPGVLPGFMPAVSALLREAGAAHSPSGRNRGNLRLPFLYGAELRHLVLKSVRAAGSPPEDTRLLESELEITDEKNKTLSRFKMTYRFDDSKNAVPTRIVYRPRWWIELELLIEEPGTH
jgi:hypothetical protein